MLSSLFGRKTTSDFSDDSYIPQNFALPGKFRPFILNYQNGDLRNKVRESFSSKTESIFWGMINWEKKPQYECKERKNHVRTYEGLEGWIIKFNREDLDVGKDAHLYRVRKAHKIQNLIDANGWQELIVVPKKYLYFHLPSKKWYVIAQKVELGKGSLTPKQAAAAAKIILETGLADVHQGNILFDRNGRVAFIDTEPVTRNLMKKQKISIWNKVYLLQPALIKFNLGLYGTGRLIGLVKNKEGILAIKAVQWEALSKHLIETALKIVGLAIAIRYLGLYPPLTILLQLYLSAKIISLVFDSLSSIAIYNKAVT